MSISKIGMNMLEVFLSRKKHWICCLSNLVIPKRNLAPFWSVQLPNQGVSAGPHFMQGERFKNKIGFLELQGPNCLNFKGLLHSMQLDQKLFRLLITLQSTRHSDIIAAGVPRFTLKKAHLFHLFSTYINRWNVMLYWKRIERNQTLCQLDPTGRHQATPRNPDNPPMNRNIYIPLDWT